MRQKTDPGNDFDLSDESSSFNLEQLSAFMTGEGRSMLSEALRRFAGGQPPKASVNPSAQKRRADEVEEPREEPPHTSSTREKAEAEKKDEDDCRQPGKNNRTPSSQSEEPVSAQGTLYTNTDGTQYFALHGQGKPPKRAGDESPSYHSCGVTDDA